MLRKWFAETPKGILVIAVTWFAAAGLLAAGWAACLDDLRASVRSSAHIYFCVPWESTVLAEFLDYTPVVIWLGFVIGAFSVAIRLLQKNGGAARVARYLSIAWVLFWLAPVLAAYAESDSGLDLFATSCFLSGAGFNLWSWWYLSREQVQKKLSQELVLLNLHSA